MKRGSELAINTLVTIVLLLFALVILMYLMNSGVKGIIGERAKGLTDLFYSALVQR